MKKKVFCFILAVFLFLFPSLSVNASAAATVQSNSRIDAILELSGLNDVPANTFSIISLQGDSSYMRSLGAEGNMAIQSAVVNNEYVEVTTIIPYKVTASGELANSFEYDASSNQTRNIANVTSTFVDVSVTVKTYYAHYYSKVDIMNFYRHSGFEAYWSSNNATVTVDRLEVLYESLGELYAYPECIEQHGCKVQDEDYPARSYINIANPPKGQLYVSPQAPMPMNRVLYLTDGMFHGGSVYVELEYCVNGNYRTDFEGYDLYTK